MVLFNPRNHSKEVGYYISMHLRGQGLGYIMLTLLLKIVFFHDGGLNKIYATTSSGNIPSTRLLQKPASNWMAG